jgi:hypothetical protein
MVQKTQAIVQNLYKQVPEVPLVIEATMEEQLSKIGKHLSFEKLIFLAKILVHPKTCKWDSLQKSPNSLQLTSTLEVADSCKYKEFSFGTDTNIFIIESTFV